jgi:hypothetical protein
MASFSVLRLPEKSCLNEKVLIKMLKIQNDCFDFFVFIVVFPFFG